MFVTRQYLSDLGQLADMRACVQEACRQVWGADAGEEAIAQVKLALQEAASNIVRHSYQGQADQPIELVVDVSAEQVCVSLYHRGRGFDPSAVRPPSFDGSRSEGFGLFLIRESVDEVHYFCDENGRQGVQLVKRIKT